MMCILIYALCFIGKKFCLYFVYFDGAKLQIIFGLCKFFCVSFLETSFFFADAHHSFAEAALVDEVFLEAF